MKKNSFFKDIIENRQLYVLILPAVIFFILFAYIPMAGIVVTFKNYNYTGGIFGSPWNGLANFKFIFMNNTIYKVIFNTFAYNITFIIIGTVLQVSGAIFLSEIESKAFRRITQSMIFMPYFISWVVVASFLNNIFNFEFGVCNNILKSMGMQPIDLLNDSTNFKYLIVAFQAWKAIGFGIVIYLASIMGIDNELYQAAVIDGANKFEQIQYITLPLLVPQLVILILLSIGSIFRGDFMMFYQLTGSNPLLYESTDVIDTYVVRSLLKMQDYGMASASGFVQAILCFFVIIGANFIVKKYQPDYSLF